jgi:hypothetical protein
MLEPTYTDEEIALLRNGLLKPVAYLAHESRPWYLSWLFLFRGPRVSAAIAWELSDSVEYVQSYVFEGANSPPQP